MLKQGAGRDPRFHPDQLVAKQYISPAQPLCWSWSVLKPRVPSGQIASCKALDAAGDDAPDLQGLSFLRHDIGVGGGARLELASVAIAVQHSDDELALDNRHDDAAIAGAQLPVHHDDVAVIDAVFLHGRAGHAQQECGLGVRDQQVCNIQPLACEVIGGRACARAAISQRQSNRGRDQLDGHTTHKAMTVHMYSVAVDGVQMS